MSVRNYINLKNSGKYIVALMYEVFIADMHYDTFSLFTHGSSAVRLSPQHFPEATKCEYNVNKVLQISMSLTHFGLSLIITSDVGY